MTRSPIELSLTAKRSFLSNFENHHCSLLPAAALSQIGRIAVYQKRNGNKKCIFEAPHNEMKCVLSIKESDRTESEEKVIFTE